MMRGTVSLLLACVTVINLHVVTAYSDMSIIGYMPEYRHASNYDYERAFALGLTHVIFFSLEVSTTAPYVPAALDRLPPPDVLKRARAAADKHKGRLLICFGGNSRTGGFPEMVKTKKSRQVFLHALDLLLHEKNLDGVDFNWEYPRNEAEWRGLVELIKEANHLLSDRGGPTLTMAYYPDSQQFDIITKNRLYNYLDCILSMSYDARGRHSELSFAKSTLESLKKNNLPFDQFALGVPFYGRDMRTGEPKTYAEILPALIAKAKEYNKTNPGVFDELHNVNEFGSQFFNGAGLIKEKVKMAGKLGSNIMIWELGQDSSLGHPRSLLKAAGKAKRESLAERARERLAKTEL